MRTDNKGEEPQATEPTAPVIPSLDDEKNETIEVSRFIMGLPEGYGIPYMVPRAEREVDPEGITDMDSITREAKASQAHFVITERASDLTINSGQRYQSPRLEIWGHKVILNDAGDPVLTEGKITLEAEAKYLNTYKPTQNSSRTTSYLDRLGLMGGAGVPPSTPEVQEDSTTRYIPEPNNAKLMDYAIGKIRASNREELVAWKKASAEYHNMLTKLKEEQDKKKGKGSAGASVKVDDLKKQLAGLRADAQID